MYINYSFLIFIQKNKTNFTVIISYFMHINSSLLVFKFKINYLLIELLKKELGTLINIVGLIL